MHTPDIVGDRMAGPGIRAWHLSRELAKHFPTTLIAKCEGSEAEGVPVIEHNTDAARAAMRDASVLIGQPARGFRKRRAGQRIVYDLFDPLVLELRELYGSMPSLRQRVHLGAEWWRLSDALMRGDLMMCAARKQRAFYEKLQSGSAPWIEVPFGIDLGDVKACAKPQDDIVVWGGGVWEWLDPATAVEAVVRLNAEGTRVKLLFLGRARPNSMQLIDRRRESRFDTLLERGGPFVSANDAWVPYRERLAWLRSGKIAIMLHRRTAEAEYSIRTRLFDAIAAGIPVIASAGGFAAELVEQEGLGIVVSPGDAAGVAVAIRRLLTDDELYFSCVKGLERIRPRFAWELVTRPLVRAVAEMRT
ncbi:MAG TPA: glycosyltransferase [Thermoanaerobaculia bacterium]|nr:glycosyltransferase [Thermoanaerobaculia bacterium]